MQYTITGNTYEIRDIAKDAGFSWIGTEWVGTQEAADRWIKITNASWSGRNANRVRKANASVKAMSINDLMAPADSIY